jgi:dTDP-4-amino-4,6-dideoxygalactose transaminase
MSPDSIIRISEPRLNTEAERLVVEVIRSGRLSQGPMVERLENEFAAIAGTRHAVAVANGTLALVVALEGLELTPGAEVITTPFTFVATVNAVLASGLVARLVDVDDTMSIDPKSIEAAIGTATEAVLPVHLYGLPADLPAIETVARKRGLALVEDAAQAHGATIRGRPVGSFGVGCFSFYATKNLTTGEGGVVTSDDADLVDRLRLLRNQGMRDRYEYEIPGHNFRMTELQAAVGCAVLPELGELNARRRRNAAVLSELLAGIEGVRLPEIPADRESVFHQYTMRVTPAAAVDRLTLAEGLKAEGIETGIYYPRAIPDYECYRSHPGVRVDDIPNARAAAREVLSLPVHPALGDAELRRIGQAVRRAFRLR